MTIGEAGQGHTFHSEYEGPIDIPGVEAGVPLLQRTIFASKIGENIMSVSEAVDNGYTVVFDRSGVKLFQKVVISGEPALSGGRNPRSRLFYFNFKKIECKSVLVGPVTQLQTSVGPRVAPLALISVKDVNKMISDLFHDERIRRMEGPKQNMEVPKQALIKLCDAEVRLAETYVDGITEEALWHGRMIHINPKMAKLANPALKKFPDKMECDHCILGKFHKHPHSGSRPTQGDFPWAPGEYLTGDMFGPVLRSEGGATYVDFYIDVKSRFVYANLLASKKDQYNSIEEVRADLRPRSGVSSSLTVTVSIPVAVHWHFMRNMTYVIFRAHQVTLPAMIWQKGSSERLLS